MVCSETSLSRGWRPPESGERSPSANDVYRDSEILDQWMTKKNAEDVEHVMAVIRKSERMDNGIVADYHQHRSHHGTDDGNSWIVGRIGEEPSSLREVVKIEKRPREKGKVRPDVEHLRNMN